MKRENLIQSLADLAPLGERRMGANPHANGGLLMSELIMPDFKDYAVDVDPNREVKKLPIH